MRGRNIVFYANRQDYTYRQCKQELYALKKYLNLTNYCANGPPWIYIWTKEKIAQLEPQTKSVLFNKEKAF